MTLVFNTVSKLPSTSFLPGRAEPLGPDISSEEEHLRSSYPPNRSHHHPLNPTGVIYLSTASGSLPRIWLPGKWLQKHRTYRQWLARYCAEGGDRWVEKCKHCEPGSDTNKLKMQLPRWEIQEYIIGPITDKLYATNRNRQYRETVFYRLTLVGNECISVY